MKLTACSSVAIAVAALAGTALSCPFCEAPSLTLAEQLGQADVAVLVQWIESKAPNKDEGFAGATTYQVVDVVDDVTKEYQPESRIQLDRDRPAQPGDLFLLLGTKGTNIEWASPMAVTEASYQYMKQAPTQETPTAERLKYFVKFLEYPDPVVSTDAYGEFANAPYKDIVPIKDAFPRDDLRKWLTSTTTPKTRLGLYGLMLGLCGTDEDAQLLKQIIEEPTQEYRLGIDGIMAGYLLLTGESGLPLIEDSKLRNKDAVFSETYAGMQALRFLWTYAPERMTPDRLRASMRILLERDDLADLVITDLARWEDWSVTDRLMEMYGQGEYNIPSIKRNIVRYFLVAERAKPASAGDPPPETAVKAKEYLEHIKATDPKTYEAAKRFFILNRAEPPASPFKQCPPQLRKCRVQAGELEWIVNL